MNHQPLKTICKMHVHVCAHVCMCVCVYVGIFLGRGFIAFVIPSGIVTLEKRKITNHGVEGKCSCSYLTIDLLQVWSLSVSPSQSDRLVFTHPPEVLDSPRCSPGRGASSLLGPHGNTHFLGLYLCWFLCLENLSPRLEANSQSSFGSQLSYFLLETFPEFPVLD